ncbi:MAG TPA: winged helix-turn-helix domain-containing protein [Aestuariivirgaceae bacterium]|nr:winged helix-turn-helix domain-containing protein [Aestuariivirgaceae bacterium]
MALRSSITDAVAFGPFTLVPTQRLLMKDGAAIELGGRTLDVLITLVSRPNAVFSKRELMARVWPDVTVEEGSLRFHVAALRKALGDRKDGARYVATLPARGYCFVAPISLLSSDVNGAPFSAIVPNPNLPARLTRMIGRADTMLDLISELHKFRFVTIVGPGGVGKTTVAVSMGHDLRDAFAGAVLFIDLATLSDPDLVPTSVASMLGLSVQSEDPTPSIVAYLRGKRVVLILDSCEHVVEATARLADRIFAGAPEAYILATSREALRVEGEQVHRLLPLSFPPSDVGLTAAAALTFPAVQLFVERAAARGSRLEFQDADAPTVARICRKLDGLALAIELAAGRVEGYGLHRTAELLDQRLSLLWVGQRTAPPRQKTLRATLDWSYELLSESERLVLRRLAIFVGQFTLEAAVAVVTSEAIEEALVIAAVDSLVAKSMIATRPSGAMMRYQLLDTTRAYALGISLSEAELAHVSARCATYYQRWLEQIQPELSRVTNAVERVRHLGEVGNVRALLEWSFGSAGNIDTGIAIASVAAPFFLAMSLLNECHRWSERALLALGSDSSTTREEMHLQAARGMSLMYTRGEIEEVQQAFGRSLELAEERMDSVNQVQLLGMLHMFHHRKGRYQSTIDYARRSGAVADITRDPATIALARCLLGISLHHLGDLSGARVELEAATQHDPVFQSSGTILLGFDQGRSRHRTAGVALARTLWLQGHPAQALHRARRTVREAARTDHPVIVSIALNWAISVFLWAGDLAAAEEHVHWFISNAEAHSLAPYLAAGRGFQGELAIRRGDAQRGVVSLEACLGELHALRYELLTTGFNVALVLGLAAIGRLPEALVLIDETIALAEANGDLLYMPELLRAKGSVLLSTSQSMAELLFVQSLEWGHRQGARSWELRTATDLAALWSAQGRREAAKALLQPLFEQFIEAQDTADVKSAGRLLATLG